MGNYNMLSKQFIVCSTLISLLDRIDLICCT